MLSHKLSNLLKLYRSASRVESLNAISHCANEFNKILAKIEGQDVDPMAKLYLKNLDIVHQSCKDIVKKKTVEESTIGA